MNGYKVIAVTWQAPWLIPYESDFHWMMPVAGLVLLIPFFFVSWWSEYFVARKMIRDIEPVLIKKSVLKLDNIRPNGVVAYYNVANTKWVIWYLQERNRDYEFESLKLSSLACSSNLQILSRQESRIKSDI